MAVEIWQYARPKGRSPRWAFRVVQGQGHAVEFESNWVSVRYVTREDAEWLAGLVDTLVTRGVFAGCPGHTRADTLIIPWIGDLDDDCWTRIADLFAHAEWMFGPRRGGNWFCSISRNGDSLFHTTDFGIQPRSGGAARWICEVVISAAVAGIV